MKGITKRLKGIQEDFLEEKVSIQEQTDEEEN